MNTAMSLNNVLPVPASRGAHSPASAKRSPTLAGRSPALAGRSEDGPARSSSPYDAGSTKNGAIRQDQQISPEESSSDNLERIDTETQPKAKPTRNTDFKNVLKRQIKSQESTDAAVSPQGCSAEQKAEIDTPEQDNNSASDGSQPVATPVTTNEVSTTDTLNPDNAVGHPLPVAQLRDSAAGPVSNTSPQDVDAPQTQITDTLIINGPSLPVQNQQLAVPDKAAIIQNQPQPPQPDSSQQNQPTASDQPVLDTSQLITTPDKPNPPVNTQVLPASQSQNGEQIINNQSTTANSTETQPRQNPDTAKPQSPIPRSADGAIKTNASQIPDKSTEPEPASNTNSSNSAKQNSAILSKDQPNTIPAESPTPQVINSTKANHVLEPKPAKSQEQNRQIPHNEHSGENAENTTQNKLQPLSINQPPVSQGKNTASPEKSDTPKAELQNVNTTSQIARGQTIPESNINVTNTNSGKMAIEAARNLAATDNNPAAAIREQISQSVTAASQQVNRQITIQLNPPELGKVSIKFSQTGSELTGLIEASNPRTRADINQQIPEILRSLEQAGVTVKHIDVTLSDLPGRSNPDSQRDNSSQSGWDRSGGNNYQDSGRQHFASDSFTAPATFSSYQPPATSHERLSFAGTAAGSSSLDVLI